MRQLPPSLRRKDRYDLGSVLSDSTRRRQNEIVWITRGEIFYLVLTFYGAEEKSSVSKKGDKHGERSKRVERHGYVERDEHERWWWPSVHPNQRGQELHHPLPSVWERDPYRGGASSHRRCRLRDLQADQRPGERTQLL